VAQRVQLLAPCLHTLPKPHFGLKEDVFALRNRHLDLLVNAPSRAFLTARAAVVRSVRSVLESHGFMEMQTPVLQSVASGASARPFETHHAAYDSKVGPLLLQN
jgi:lysyl-tRNA synthetase class 2